MPYDNRWQSKTLSEFIISRHGYTLGESLFFFMSGSSVLERKVGTSVLNPEYVSFIGGLIDEPLEKFPKLL